MNKEVRRTRNRIAAAVPTDEEIRAMCHEEGDCLMWQGYMANGTVPMMMATVPRASDPPDRPPQRRMNSVRAIFTHLLTGEPIKAGYYVPKCEHARCVAPAHTAFRDSKTHMRTMWKSLRKMPVEMAMRNAKISKAKRRLSDEAIQEIMTSSEPASVVAARLGCSKATVCGYRRGTRGMQRGSNPFAELVSRMVR
jgi:histone H3/H4